MKTITPKQIREWVGSKSYERGQRYFERGYIFDTRREDNTFRARCRGSYDVDYRLEVTLDGAKIISGHCSCPVGGGGYCKHVAAMLLTWRDSPEDFREVTPLKDSLQKLKKAELIALIERMLLQEPDLESLLEISVQASGSEKTPPDSEVFRRQAQAAFQSAGYGWEADAQVTADLEAIKDIGDGLLEQNNPVAAAAVYEGILDGIIDEYASFDDETGNTIGVAQDCIQALGDCLPQLDPSSSLRSGVLKTLFDVLNFDIQFGGISLSDDVPDIILNRASAEERETIAGWVEEAAAREMEDHFSAQFHKKWYGSLLLEFRRDQLDEAELEKQYREFGLTQSLIEHLLKTKRVEEALTESETVGDSQLPGVANLLVSHRLAEQAEALVLKRAKKSDHYALESWLEDFYRKRKKWGALLSVLEKRFQENPALAGYREIRKIAKKVKKWKQVQPKLVEQLDRDVRNSDVLIEIHLEEGDVDAALALLNSPNRKRRRDLPIYGNHFYDGIHIKVARAAEKKQPEAALGIYLQEAELLITRRGRENYREACRFLKNARSLYKTMKRTEDWKECIRAIRNENPRLRALQEELAMAKL